MRRFLALFAVSVALTACAPRSSPMGTAWGPGSFATNGERIYFASTSERGGRITYSGGPGMGGMMMGGTLTCASCHGPTGRGGQHTMHMTVMDAPDVRWSALADEGHEDEQGEEEHGHGDEGAEYNLETFRLAVVQGKHPDGKPLKDEMPRWHMSDGDLSDLLEHLRSLS